MSDQLGFIPAEGDGVVAVSGPRGPGGDLRREYRRHLRRVRQVAQRQGRVDDGQPRLMGKQLRTVIDPLDACANSGQ